MPNLRCARRKEPAERPPKTATSAIARLPRYLLDGNGYWNRGPRLVIVGDRQVELVGIFLCLISALSTLFIGIKANQELRRKRRQARSPS